MTEPREGVISGFVGVNRRTLQKQDLLPGTLREFGEDLAKTCGTGLSQSVA